MRPPRAAPLPRGRHGLTREQVVRTQRRRMIVAMAETVAETGYARTTVAQVIRRAGVSRETFYEQFDDKESCFLAAYDACAEWMLAAMAEAAPGPGADPVERFGRWFAAYLRIVCDEPAFARTFLVEVYGAGPAALERRMAVQRRFVDAVAGVLGARSARRRFDCEAVVAAVGTLAGARIAAGAPDAVAALYDPVMDLVRRLFGGE